MGLAGDSTLLHAGWGGPYYGEVVVAGLAAIVALLLLIRVPRARLHAAGVFVAVGILLVLHYAAFMIQVYHYGGATGRGGPLGVLGGLLLVGAGVSVLVAERRAERCLHRQQRQPDRPRMESILEAIGNTPLVRVHRCAPSNGAELWLKLEYRNPTGSMKDRMALAMIEGAERDGLLSPGDTVVEYTGGSTGPALALVCRAKGYRALIVMADCFTEERFQLMRALGAEVDVVPSVEGRPKVTAKDIENMVARAAELASAPDHYATDQFNNPYIVRDHRDRLGREIWEQSAAG